VLEISLLGSVLFMLFAYEDFTMFDSDMFGCFCVELILPPKLIILEVKICSH